MFGVYIYGPAIILNDKRSAVNSSSNIEYTLNKKHISIDYHLVRQNVVSIVVHIRCISTEDNISETLTKILTEAKAEM